MLYDAYTGPQGFLPVINLRVFLIITCPENQCFFRGVRLIWKEEQGTFGGKTLLVFTILFCTIPFCAVKNL